MKPALLLGLLFLVSCSQKSAFQNEVVKLEVELTNVSHPLLKTATIKVDEIHLQAMKDGQEKTFIIGKNTGVIKFDDLQISSGFKISDLLVESGIDVKSLTLILSKEGNLITKKDQTQCKHQTSPAPTRVEVKLPHQMKLVPGHDYTLTMDFDAPESVYLLAGDCHFTPKIVMRPIQRSIANVDLGPASEREQGEDDYLPSEDQDLVD